jgi:nitrile hydratase subunit beta
MGGQTGFGAVPVADSAPVFHADWEARAYALVKALQARGHFNADEMRDAIERLPPREYLTTSYYEKWLAGVELLVAEKGLAT